MYWIYLASWQYNSWKLIFFFIFVMAYECFVYMYVSASYAGLVPSKAKRVCQVPWDWKYSQLWHMGAGKQTVVLWKNSQGLTESPFTREKDKRLREDPSNHSASQTENKEESLLRYWSSCFQISYSSIRLLPCPPIQLHSNYDYLGKSLLVTNKYLFERACWSSSLEFIFTWMYIR